MKTQLTNPTSEFPKKRKKPCIKDYFHRSPTKHSFRSLIPTIDPIPSKLKDFKSKSPEHKELQKKSSEQNNFSEVLDSSKPIEEEDPTGLDYDIFDLLKNRHVSKSNFQEEVAEIEKEDFFQSFGVAQVNQITKVLGVSKVRIVSKGKLSDLERKLRRVGTYNFKWGGDSKKKLRDRVGLLQAMTSAYDQMLTERGFSLFYQIFE